MKLRVEVTEEDIAAGSARACNDCPIARALIRCGLSDVAVSMAMTLAEFNGETIETTTPLIAAQFIWNFDAGLAVEPFSFDLDIPDEAP